MTYRFVALPVAQGDAFFIQRGSFTALVDGGRSAHTFSSLFTQVLNRKSVEVVICTHNDADHANGIIGFLESGLACDEVWLPALWADRLDDIITRPTEFGDELIGNIQQLQERSHSQARSDHSLKLDELGDQYSDDYHEGRLGAEQRAIVAVPQSDAALRTMPPIEGEDDARAARRWPGMLSSGSLPAPHFYPEVWLLKDEPLHQLLLQALAAAERIDAIAQAATHRSVPIRWFRYSRTYAKGGKPELLLPLNAVEVRRAGPRQIPALQYLALTTSNRLSLTFCSPPRMRYPGVIFTADSNLRFPGPVPWQAGMIVTAPHHGSEANASAYARFSSDVKGKFDVIWVRSDGNFRSRPGPSYLAQPRRFCTICRSMNLPKRSVRFAVKNRRWLPVASRQCSCQ